MKKAILKTAGVAALSASVLLTGCGKSNENATLVTIKTADGTSDTITLGYANFAARYEQSMYDQSLMAYYGEQMWSTDMYGTGTTMQDQVKSTVLSELEAQYVLKLHAADYGVELTEEQNTAIATAASQFIADNSKETLEVLGATEDIVKQYLEGRTIYSEVSNVIKDQKDAEITEDDCWMRTFSYVLFDTTGKTADDGTITEYTEDELASLKTQAEELADSDDFDTYAESLGVNVQTYSYLKGETEDEQIQMDVITAAEALAEGEVSDVIEVDGVGYYVIKLTADHDADKSDSKRESLKSEALSAQIDAWEAEIEWTVDEDLWATVTFDSLFKAPETETTETTTEETTEESTESTTEDTTEENSEETTEATSEDATEGSAEESEAE